MRGMRTLLAGAAIAALLSAPAARAAEPLDVATAKQVIEKAAAPSLPWDGPTTGPKAQGGKSVIFVSADQRNGGPLGVSEGVTEAAKVMGWQLRILDGGGSIAGRTSALTQAIALKPDVLIAGNIDAVEQKATLQKAMDAGIKVFGWHSTIKPGHDPALPLITNISTDPLNVARVSAALVVADSGGTAGVVVFTDSTEKISVLKSDAMADNIKACPGCSVLTTVDTPLHDVATRIPQMTTSLLQRYGGKWSYSLAINDGFFDFMASTLAGARRKGTDHPLNVAGGDGSKAAFERIRQGQYQMATVAEPLHLHGWQIIDEANRALAGEPISGYVAPTHLVVKSNIGKDGGADNIYDPDNGYRDVYRKIWGK
ncbi:substrate-binding domain-containing protein [Chelatococcus sp. GCM10030263]|uniref:substrate-binding domain-containing protein n=1 Tax=Chelatococcus sp. GCM10030263 TaxID=3273387 RepID=UPI003609C6AF